MKVLVTGATGQLGGALQKTVPAHIDLQSIGSADVDFAQRLKLRDRILAEAPDVLINAAAYTAVDQAESDEQVAYAINADAVGVMSTTVDELGSKLVHVSTDFVFDGTSPRAYRPDDERAPISAYGRTKAAGEDHLGKNALLVRTAWVYAAGGKNFVRTMVRLMRERDELPVVADQIGSPTWATGLARTIWALVAAGATGTFHHSDCGVASWYDFAVAIAEEAHALGLIARIPAIKPISTDEYPTPAQRPRFSLLDSDRTRQLLDQDGIHWRTNLRAMLKEEQTLG